MTHWCESLHGGREPASWRAASPCCHLDRALSWWPATDWRIDWRCHCTCPRAAVRAALAKIVPCFTTGRAPKSAQIKADDLKALLLSGMPPQSIKLAGLEMAGISTPEALDELGIRRENRARVIAGCASFWMQNRR